MSTDSGEEIFGIGQRLREERDRAGLSQATLAGLLATSSRTVISWESSGTYPKASDLLLMHGQGMDIMYIVTGQRPALGIAEPAAPYVVATDLASHVAMLKLSEPDAALLRAMADRLAK